MKSNSKYLFICSAYPEEFDSFYKKLSGNDSTISGTIHSSSIIDGFKEKGINCFVISGVGVGHYPINTKTKKVPSKKFSDSFYSVGYNNHFLVSQKSKQKAIVECFKKHCEISDEPLNILLADIHEPFIKAALKIKKHYPNSKIVNICLDVPETIVSSKETFLRKLLKRISIKRNRKLLKKVDGFILLSEMMKNRLPINNKPYFVSPCICNINQYEGLKKEKHATKIVAYCGVLSKQYNIDLLVDAFLSIKRDDMELVLAGKGDAISFIKEKSNLDKRIKYLGELTRNQATQLQLNADILVNPRLPEEHYTSYSFPSKTLSYLLSGNPVICYSFSSFPDDIRKMVFEPQETNKESLALTILSCLNKTSKLNYDTIKKYTPSSFIDGVEKLFSKIRNYEKDKTD